GGVDHAYGHGGPVAWIARRGSHGRRRGGGEEGKEAGDAGGGMRLEERRRRGQRMRACGIVGAVEKEPAERERAHDDPSDDRTRSHEPSGRTRRARHRFRRDGSGGYLLRIVGSWISSPDPPPSSTGRSS